MSEVARLPARTGHICIMRDGARHMQRAMILTVALVLGAILLVPAVAAVPCPFLKPVRENYAAGDSLLRGALYDDWDLRGSSRACCSLQW